jgi:hypothetical protein
MPNRGGSSAVLKQHLLQVVDALQGIGLPYMVVGAFALTAWDARAPRSTFRGEIPLVSLRGGFSSSETQSRQAPGFYRRGWHR